MDHRLDTIALACALAVTACGGSTRPPATRPSSPPDAAAAPATASGVAPPPVPSVAPAATASVTGRITSSSDHTPVPRARVILSSPAAGESRVAIAGADGTYRFDRLRSGTYALSVTATGFAPAQFGERRAAPPVPMAVSDGQAVTGADVALQPAGVIAGQLLDEDERPFAGATVEALVSRTVDGRATFVSVASTQTDDRGQFRLVGLAAGQYYVSALDPAFAQATDDGGPLRYTPTYYPGVAMAEEATRVTVTPGVEPNLKIVFRLKIIRPARVAGILRTQDGRQLISGAVVMTPIYGEGLAAVPSQDVTILPDGSFAFRNVPPGQYQIRARGDVESNGITRFATFRIRVEGRDIAGVDMTLVPGATVHGRIVVESSRRTASPRWTTLRVRAPFVDGTSFGDTLDGQVQDDASWGIHGVMAGGHVLTIEGLPYPWVVKDVAWRGRDITDTGIEAESVNEYTDVRITIADVASEVRGVVRDANAKGVSDALVLIIPPASQFWTRTSRRFVVTRTDAGGRFQVRGLPAGEYRAVALSDLDESEAYRHDVLKPLAAAGHVVSLAQNAMLSIDLPLTPLVARTQAAAR